MFGRLREYTAIARDMLASCTDAALTFICGWAIFFLYTTGTASMIYAGHPPSTLSALTVLKDDPFLLQRLESWGTAAGCAILAGILAVSFIEGCWALLRRI